MAFGDIQGRARTSVRSPRAKGVCDDCGEWYVLTELNKQMEFFGPALKWTGFLVCDHCLDRPQDQNRPIILPPDPVPVVNPRPENFNNDYGLQGFSQYSLFVPPEAQQDEATVLPALASASGIPTPAIYNDAAGVIVAQNVAQTLVPARGRSWLALYNSAQNQLTISLTVAVWGMAGTLIIGPGEALQVSGSGTPQGAISGVGLTPGSPYNAWDAV